MQAMVLKSGNYLLRVVISCLPIAGVLIGTYLTLQARVYNNNNKYFPCSTR